MSIQVFVSTQETQGQRPNDFCYVPEGEIVTFGVFTCTGEMADGPCGCARSLGGVETHKATTTMKVVAFDHTFDDLTDIIARFLTGAGWDNFVHTTHAGETAMRLTSLAAPFAVGTVVEYRDGVFVEREKEQIA